jgi:hypothetical protein
MTGAAWRAATMIVAGVGDLVQRNGDGRTCAVCTVPVETRSTGFLVEPQNQGRRFVSALASKPLGQFASALASKPLGRFPGLVLKTGSYSFMIWASKSS